MRCKFNVEYQWTEESAGGLGGGWVGRDGVHVEGGRRREESSLTIFAGVVLTVFCASANFEACRPGNFREIFITWNRIYTLDVSRVLWMERETRDF